MSGAIAPLPIYVFMAWCLVKHRDFPLRPKPQGLIRETYNNSNNGKNLEKISNYKLKAKYPNDDLDQDGLPKELKKQKYKVGMGRSKIERRCNDVKRFFIRSRNTWWKRL
jgi:hypothetical protein